MRYKAFELTLICFVMVGFCGCGKLPTWAELMGEKTVVPVADPVVAPVVATPPVAPVKPAEPTAEEIVARFKAIRPFDVTDNDIARLTSLNEGVELVTEINADSNQKLTNKAFESLEKLTNLRQLRLAGTRISNDACANIGKVQSLETLALSDTSINDIGVAALTSLVNLKHLELSRCVLTLNGFTSIGMLPSLESLSLSQTNLDNAGMKEICKCRSIKSLRLDHNPLDDNGLDFLKKLDSLELLEIGNTPIGGRGLNSVSKKLKSLSVYECPLGDPSVVAINKFKSLEGLNMGGIPIVNDLAFSKMVSGLKELRYVNLKGSKFFDGTGLKALQSAKNLERLHLDDCPLIGDVPTVDIIISFKNLKQVSLGNTRVTATGFQKMRSANSALFSPGARGQ